MDWRSFFESLDIKFCKILSSFICIRLETLTIEKFQKISNKNVPNWYFFMRFQCTKVIIYENHPIRKSPFDVRNSLKTLYKKRKNILRSRRLCLQRIKKIQFDIKINVAIFRFTKDCNFCEKKELSFIKYIHYTLIHI